MVGIRKWHTGTSCSPLRHPGRLQWRDGGREISKSLGMSSHLRLSGWHNVSCHLTHNASLQLRVRQLSHYGILQNTPVLSLLLLFSAKLCLFCNPMDCSPPSSSVHGIFQARILGCHSLLQGNLPDPGINPPSLALQVGSLPLSHQGSKSGSHSAHPETSPMCVEWKCE